MSIADIYESGEQKQNKSHLENLIAIAQVDGHVDETEKELLAKFADRLNIDSNTFNEMMNHAAKYDVIPPIDKVDRYKMLYSLVSLSLADSILDEREVSLLERYAIGLGYKEQQANELINKSIDWVTNNVSFEEAFEKI